MRPTDLIEAAEFHKAAPIPASPDDRRTIREKAGVTQAQLAVAVGCSLPAVRRWEHGPELPRGRTHQDRYGRVLAALVDYSTRLAAMSAEVAGR